MILNLNTVLTELRNDKLSERYSREMMGFLKYMKSPLDQYAAWDEFPSWFEENYGDDEDAINWLNTVTNGTVDAEGIDYALTYETDPSMFDSLPENIQKHFMSDIAELAQKKAEYDPARADTRVHMNLDDTKPLKRETWLVHFSNNAYDIAREGFTRAVSNVDVLGLTKHGLPDYEYSETGDGYAFAFFADSRDAEAAASEQKYGDDCVIFQNSGVHTYHHGDEENQIVFYARDVDPRNIIYMKEVGGDWVIMPHPGKEDRYGNHDDYDLEGGLISGNYMKMVEWIKKNHRQYSKALYGY